MKEDPDRGEVCEGGKRKEEGRTAWAGGVVDVSDVSRQSKHQDVRGPSGGGGDVEAATLSSAQKVSQSELVR